jgi:hypothetical protein
MADADGSVGAPDRDLIDTVWGLLSVRNFWLGQAQIALDALALHKLEQAG